MENADDKRVMTQPEKKDYILNGASDYFGISVEKITSQHNGNRSKLYGKKKILISILYNYTDASFTEIAQILGYKTMQSVSLHFKNLKQELSGELYGCQKTQMIYNELLTYLNLNGHENKKSDTRD